MTTIFRANPSQSRVLYLINQYELSSSKNSVFNEGIFFKDGKKRDFRLTATLELLPLHLDCLEKTRIAFNKAIGRKRFQDFFGKSAIQSALLDRAKKEGVVGVLKNSLLWSDLTSPVYEGF